ncbi:MAG: DUF2281 domain-containing protein [Planctomycetia bacterium]|nr:DUF2281 domain-containing protein [Planctomycetia bacterium]
MSPLEDALSSIRQLSADEKRRLRDYLNAELASTAEQPRPAPSETTNPTAATNFGWAREFVVVRDDFDAPLEDFREYM